MALDLPAIFRVLSSVVETKGVSFKRLRAVFPFATGDAATSYTNLSVFSGRLSL